MGVLVLQGLRTVFDFFLLSYSQGGKLAVIYSFYLQVMAETCFTSTFIIVIQIELMDRGLWNLGGIVWENASLSSVTGQSTPEN